MQPGSRISTAGLLAALMAVLLASCSPTQDSAPDTTLPVSDTAAEPVLDLESDVFEMLALASHPNGAQIRVDRIELLAESTVVTGAVTNGSAFGITIGQGTFELITDKGQAAVLSTPFEVVSVEPAGELDFTLRFEPLNDPAAVTLFVNRGGGSSPSSPTTTVPAFELGPIGLDPDATRPNLPEPVAVRLSTVDSAAAGVELRIEGVNFTENRIGVLVRISNPLALEARIAPSLALSLIEDDLGNRYPLVLPEGEGWITIPAASARSGTLSFAGRIHPGATRLNLAVNAGTDSRQDRGRLFPELIVRNIELAGDGTVALLPPALLLSDAIDHPNDVRVQLFGATFSDVGIEIPVSIANGRNETVGLAATGSLLVDNMGNRYPFIPSPDNPRLVVDAGTTVEATLAFSGRIADSATSLSVVFNAGRSETDPNTREPSFTFGPYPLERSGERSDPVEAEVFAVGLRSRLIEDELAVSQVDRITQTLTQFDATAIDGGFQLTLPDSIIFDFGSAELRPDARHALTLIAEVLEYFGTDLVIVVGHSDSVGNADANQRLSEQRARSVADALIQEHGVSPDRITAEGRGSTEPVAPNLTPDGEDNPEGRQLNRRVEIVVLTDQPLPVP
jgi:outer membrane protein OmpA-like peptidoglycan-associated protein